MNREGCRRPLPPSTSRTQPSSRPRLLREARRAVVLGGIICLCGLWSDFAFADRAAAQTSLRAGNTAYYAGDYAGAETQFTAAIAADDTWAIPYNNRGLARLHRGDFANAEADFEAAKTRDVAYVAPYLNKGKCLAVQKKFSQAETELQAGLAKASTNAKLLFNLGWVLDEQGRALEAMSKYDAALSADTNYHRARVARGVTLAKGGAASDAIAAFYAAINAIPSGDMLASIASYNLQLLRGGAVTFHNDSAAQDFRDGVFALSAGLDDQAIAKLQSARGKEADVPDIPWLLSWGHLRARNATAAGAALADAYALMPSIDVRSWYESSVYLDGIPRGRTPATVRLFPSRFDLTLRSTVGGKKRERALVLYGNQPLPIGNRAILALPAIASTFTAFGPIQDDDRDWLADSWEVASLGGHSSTPDADDDQDGVINLREYWLGTDPKKADSDSDGTSDREELKNGTNPAGTGSLPPLAIAQGTNITMISSSGHNPGAEHTQWLSDAVIHNPSDKDGTASLYFLKGAQDNCDVPAVRVTVPAGQSLKLHDVVKESFGEDPASGAVLIGSSFVPLITSRTYNTAASGTFGQYIEGYPIESAITAGESVRLIQLTKNANYRTNIGYANATGTYLTVKTDIFDASGGYLGTRNVTVEPYGFLQETDPIGKLGASAEDAYAVVSSTTPGAKYFTYASVIDNRTGDPINVVPVGRDGSGAAAPPEAAASDGARAQTQPLRYSPIAPADENAAELRSVVPRPADINRTTPGLAAVTVRTLTNGVPFNDSVTFGGADTWKYYKLAVPADATKLEVTITNATGDDDLRLKYNELADLTHSDYNAITPSGNESITINPGSTPVPLQGGDWYMAVSINVGSSSYTITATYTIGPPCTLACAAIVAGTAYMGDAVSLQGDATASNCYKTTSYRWDFGDGSPAATTKTVLHSWANAGLYTWTLTATNGAGQCTKNGTITVSGMPIYVPAAAHVAGTLGTNWRHDVEVHNPGTVRASYTIGLLKRDTDNSAPATQSFTLDPGKSMRYGDIVMNNFGFDGAATLRVTPTSGKLMVTGRSYNDVPSGTYGQFIPGQAESKAINFGESARLVQLSQSTDPLSGFRTNVGFSNASAKTIGIEAKLYRGNGTLIGTNTYSLAPYEYKQFDKIFRSLTGETIEDGYAVVSTTTDGGKFFAYASVIANRSGDPIYIPARVPLAAVRTFHIGDTTDSYTHTRYFSGNVFQATKDVTLVSFDQYLGLSSACDVELYLHEGTAGSGPWTVVWMATVKAGAGTGYVGSPTINARLKAGKYYGLGAGWNCTAISYGSWKAWKDFDAGLGLFKNNYWSNYSGPSTTFSPSETGTSSLAYDQVIRVR